jgi:hypothetical protein
VTDVISGSPLRGSGGPLNGVRWQEHVHGRWCVVQGQVDRVSTAESRTCGLLAWTVSMENFACPPSAGPHAATSRACPSTMEGTTNTWTGSARIASCRNPGSRGGPTRDGGLADSSAPPAVCAHLPIGQAPDRLTTPRVHGRNSLRGSENIASAPASLPGWQGLHVDCSAAMQ